MISLDTNLILAALQSLGVRLHLEMPLEVWHLAGERFGLYARKRREGGLPRRILADFLIGAHAFYHSFRLATFDPLPYHTAFPELEVLP
jgi:predicted nucleic acid-binding protein